MSTVLVSSTTQLTFTTPTTHHTKCTGFLCHTNYPSLCVYCFPLPHQLPITLCILFSSSPPTTQHTVSTAILCPTNYPSHCVYWFPLLPNYPSHSVFWFPLPNQLHIILCVLISFATPTTHHTKCTGFLCRTNYPSHSVSLLPVFCPTTLHRITNNVLCIM